MPGFAINTVTLTGNLTADPEVRHIPSGMAVVTMRLAFNERVKDSQGNWDNRGNFIDVTVWGAFAESIAKQVGKGSSVAVGGRLRWEEWQAKDGTNRQTMKIVADSVVPIPRGDGQRSGRREAPSDVPADFDPGPVQQTRASAPAADDSIPF